MSGFDPEMTNRGNYRCPYCKHKSWKRPSAAEKHIRELHSVEAENVDLRAKVGRLEREKQQIKDAYTPQPAAKPKTEYYDDVVYCINCQTIHKVGMPKGVLVENVIHSECGNQTLRRVINTPSWWWR